jgi:hypothetical protein
MVEIRPVVMGPVFLVDLPLPAFPLSSFQEECCIF